MKHTVFLVAALACVLSILPLEPAHASTLQVAGETSRTPPQAALRWKLAAFPARNSAHAGYREMKIQRLLELQRHNASTGLKATQIGIGRELTGEGIARTTPALRWVVMKGGSVARLQIHSPDALGLRVGLHVKGLHPHVELRFGGSDEPSRVIALVTGAEAQQLADREGIFWTPATDGATQTIELYRPAHVAVTQARVQAPYVSHLLANSRNDFKIVQKVGESASCNVDAVCRVAELGPAYVQAKNAVAHMVFNLYTVSGGLYGTYICTGTLLNDTAPSTQTPWFYTADHCFAGGSDGIPAQDRSKVAASLNTYWGYENSSCGGANGVKANPLTGGADVMFNDTHTDAMLLRLRNPAPASATFAGWDASPLAANAQVIGIHHPSGDAKKVSQGQQMSSPYAGENGVAWLSGTTEGGSSGSGLFTLYRDGSYRLRGGLHGGSASCANSSSTANAGNRDYYSRLDLIFPQVKQWLASEPVREYGTQPLVRSAGAVAQGQGARIAPVAGAAGIPAAQQRTRRIAAPARTTMRER